ncbi:hypothetical protein Q1695_007829 [Nippostrongylus brasiliensis]|nr:hypothetical protein Q1695_007829 [Nippostrongylus brasiliensis]
MDDDSQPAKPLFTMNTDQEAVLIGIIYISLSGFMIPFYLIFLWVMCTSKDLKKVLMYRLMNHINLIDFGQLFIGSTVNSFWQAMFPYICVLSVSRILIIKKRMDSEKLNLGLKSKKTVSGRKSYRNEILIFCQATFLNGWMLGLMASWHGSAWLGLTKNYHQCIIDCVWILFSYLNPILLFVLNRTIRNKVLQFILPWRQVKVAATTITGTMVM